jgi:hypothetical protein
MRFTPSASDDGGSSAPAVSVTRRCPAIPVGLSSGRNTPFAKTAPIVWLIGIYRSNPGEDLQEITTFHVRDVQAVGVSSAPAREQLDQALLVRGNGRSMFACQVLQDNRLTPPPSSVSLD